MLNTFRSICLLLFAIQFASSVANAQSITKFADSIRHAKHIPELGYAVVTADSIELLNVSGVQRY